MGDIKLDQTGCGPDDGKRALSHLVSYSFCNSPTPASQYVRQQVEHRCSLTGDSTKALLQVSVPISRSESHTLWPWKRAALTKFASPPQGASEDSRHTAAEWGRRQKKKSFPSWTIISPRRRAPTLRKRNSSQIAKLARH